MSKFVGRLPGYEELTFDQRLGEIAASLLGVSRLRVWHDQTLVKEAGGRETDPHHDQPYWPIKKPIPLQLGYLFVMYQNKMVN